MICFICDAWINLLRKLIILNRKLIYKFIHKIKFCPVATFCCPDTFCNSRFINLSYFNVRSSPVLIFCHRPSCPDPRLFKIVKLTITNRNVKYYLLRLWIYLQRTIIHINRFPVFTNTLIAVAQSVPVYIIVREFFRKLFKIWDCSFIVLCTDVKICDCPDKFRVFWICLKSFFVKFN